MTATSTLKEFPLYVADAKLITRWEELMNSWRASYPGIDHLSEVRRAHGWEMANERNRKKDRPRFLTNWMARAHQRYQEFRDKERRREGERDWEAVKKRDRETLEALQPQEGGMTFRQYKALIAKETR